MSAGGSFVLPPSMLIKVDGSFVAGIGLRTPSSEIPESVYVVDPVFGRFGLSDLFVIEVRVLDGTHEDFTRVRVRELVELLRGPIRSR